MFWGLDTRPNRQGQPQPGGVFTGSGYQATDGDFTFGVMWVVNYENFPEPQFARVSLDDPMHCRQRVPLRCYFTVSQ